MQLVRLLPFSVICLIIAAKSTSALTLIDWEKSIPGQGGAKKLITAPDSSFYVCFASGLITRFSQDGDSLYSRQVANFGALDWAVNSADEVFVIGTAGLHLVVRKLNADGSVAWNYRFDPLISAGNAILATPDGGCIAAGSSENRNGDALAIKLSASGEQGWWHNYGGTNRNEIAVSMALFDSSSFLMAVIGDHSGFTWLNYSMGLRIGLSGNAIWSRTFFDNNLDWTLTSCYPSSDGGALFAGYYQRQIEWTNDRNPILTKCGAQGEVEWTRVDTIEFHGDFGYNSICSTNDTDEILAVGSVDRYDSPEPRGFHLKSWTNAGILIDSAQFFGTNLVGVSPLDVIELKGGGFVISGIETGPGTYLAKFCSDSADYGTLRRVFVNDQWTGLQLVSLQGQVDTLILPNVEPTTLGYVTGAAAVGWYVLENGDGNNGDSIIFRSTGTIGPEVVDTFWVRTPDPTCLVTYQAGSHRGEFSTSDSRLDLTDFWVGRYQGFIRIEVQTNFEMNIGHHEFWGRATRDQSYVLLRTIYSVNYDVPHVYRFDHHVSSYYQYLLKVVDLNGCETEYPELIRTEGINTDVTRAPTGIFPEVYAIVANPNPFNSTTRLEISLPYSGIEEIKLYDVLGRLVLTVSQDFYPAGKSFVPVDASLLASGVYFATLNGEHQTATCKLLLLK